MNGFKVFLLILLGVVIACAVACLTLTIGCAINGLSMGDQIVQWFGNQAVAEEVEQVATACISGLKGLI